MNVKVNFHDILFVEACRNSIQVITWQQQFMVLLSMHQMEEILPETIFCQVHSSYIVSLNHITDAGEPYPLFQK